MLIVNADDLGRNRSATDRTLECHAAGRITSTSAMVFMADSHRAAALASDSGIEIGLHLNLSEPFSDPAVPESLRRQQARLCAFLRAGKFALIAYHPFLRSAFHSVVHAQLAEFSRLFGRQPSHLDGHQHMHLATNVLVDRLLPAGSTVRRSFSFLPGERPLLNRWYRKIVDRHLASRFRVVDQFHSLSSCMSTERLRRIVVLANTQLVELMVHPERLHETEFLLGDEYANAIASAQLSTHAAGLAEA